VLAPLAFELISALAGQRYALPSTAVVPVEMHASCAPEANAEVNRGAAWLLLLAPREARHAFDRAAEVDADCALAYWGRAASYLPIADETPAALDVEAGASAIVRARAVATREPHERALVDALTPVFLPGVRGDGHGLALPARVRQYRDGVCAAQRGPAKAALTLFCARATWLGSTMPGDGPSIDATRIVAEAFDGDALPIGGALVLLQADAAPPALTRAAARAVLRLAPPSAVAWHLASRALVAAGEWALAAESGEGALARAASPIAGELLLGRRGTSAAEWLLEAYGQQGRVRDGGRLLESIGKALAEGASSSDVDGIRARHRAAFTRMWSRWIVLARSDPAPPSMPEALSTAETSWLMSFTTGLRAALDAWPAGRPDLMARAREAMKQLQSSYAATQDPEIELARVLVEASLAASLDEHHTLEVLMAHAADLEGRLTRTRRGFWPIVVARELAAELWLRSYRDSDAIREARAALAAFPNRAGASLVLGRAAARLKHADEAASAYARVLEIRKAADAGDMLADEARKHLAAIGGGAR
jgi:tetratricopeptide (TPR) repeat protein